MAKSVFLNFFCIVVLIVSQEVLGLSLKHAHTLKVFNLGGFLNRTKSVESLCARNHLLPQEASCIMER